MTLPSPDHVPVLNKDFLITILDGNIDFCQTLHSLFTLDGFRSSFFTIRDQFYQAAESNPPQAVIIRQQFDGRDCTEVLKTMRDRGWQVPAFLIVDQETDLIDELRALGVVSLLAKPVNSRELLRSLKLVLLAPINEARLRRFTRLTPRERRVLQLITDGQSNKEAGRELGISPRTIEVHRARLMEKLGAKNTAHLIRIVLS